VAAQGTLVWILGTAQIAPGNNKKKCEIQWEIDREEKKLIWDNAFQSYLAALEFFLASAWQKRGACFTLKMFLVFFQVIFFAPQQKEFPM
jgi:hypothetical protein